MKHKFYEQAIRAHNWTSHFPEKRAEQDCAWYDAECAELRALGKESAIEKFDRLFSASLAAKSRCASPMITGPARFPVERNRKRMEWEQKHTDRMLDFLKRVKAPPAPPRTELDYGIEAKEYAIGEITVRQNTEDNRLQLLFPGKPEPDMIARLKQNGFKWSPRNKAWQRQLTPNALRSVRYLGLGGG